MEDERSKYKDFKRWSDTPELADRELGILFGIDDIPPHPEIDTLVVASNSPVKQQIVSDLLTPFGVTVRPSDSDGADEEEIKKILREMETPYDRYAARMSSRKLIPFVQQMNKGMPTIAFDTVVVNDGVVLEKPTTIDEARNMIRAITHKANHHKSYNTVSVYDGLTYATRLDSGEALYWRDSACVSFMLKTLTDSEVDTYLEQAGERVLDIAGAVDYSSELGHSLIYDWAKEKGEAGPRYQVNRVRYGQLLDLTGSTRFNDPLRSRLLTRDAFPVLRPYFQGVPTHSVEALVKSGTSIASSGQIA